MNTTTLPNGLTVLAKPDNSPLTYGNLTAAHNKATSLSNLTESWEGRKVEGYRFCVCLTKKLTRVETRRISGPENLLAELVSDEVSDALDASRDPKDYLEEPEDSFEIRMKAENFFPAFDESTLSRIDYSTDNREFIQSAGLVASREILRQAQRELKSHLENDRNRRLFCEASRIVESLRGIHVLDTIRFSPKSGSSAGKYTMKMLPRYGETEIVQLPISRDTVSLLVRAGFIRPGKRNRWKFVPEKLSQSLRYLGA